MKKSRILVISALVTIIIVQSVIIINYGNKYINCTKSTITQINENKYLNNQCKLLIHLYDRCFKISGIKLNEVHVENYKHEKISLKSLIDKKVKLIYYFDEYCCMACVDDELIRLNKIIDIIGKENAIILVNFTNYKDYYQFKCRNEIKCGIYNTNGCQLGIETKKESLIFIVNNDLKIEKFFIPIKTMSEITSDYYVNILKTYFPD